MEEEVYECDRCSYKTDNKSNYKRHLYNKIPCPPTKSNVSIEELRKRLEKEKPITCDQCSKAYTTRQGLYLHKKKFHPQATQPKESTVVDLEKIKQELRQELREEIRKELASLQPSTSITNNNNNNITNNVTNNVTNITIQLREFDFENRNALTDEALKEYIKDMELENIIRDLHMNEEFPENFNVRIKNINRNLMECYQNGKWVIEEKDGLLLDIIHQSRRIANEFYYDKMKQREKITEWLQALYNEDNAEIKPLKKKIELLFIKHKDMLMARK